LLGKRKRQEAFNEELIKNIVEKELKKMKLNEQEEKKPNKKKVSNPKKRG